MLAQVGDQLRLDPQQHRFRVLAAQAAASLLLPELAGRWLDSIPAEALEEPGVVRLVEQLRGALREIPPAELPLGTRVERLRGHIEQIRDRYPIAASSLERWAEQQRSQLVWTMPDGSLVSFDPARPLEDLSNTPVRTQADAEASTLVLPENKEIKGQPTQPLIVRGLQSGTLLRRLSSEYESLPGGGRTRILLVPADELRLLDALSVVEVRERPRFEIYPTDEAALEALASSRAWWRDAKIVSTDAASDEAAMASGLRQIQAEARKRTAALTIESNARFASLSRQASGQRIRAALSGESDPLRVLIVTTRYSTYIQHSAADVASSLSAAGHKPHVLIEPDDSSVITPLATAEAIDEHQPDAIVLVNHTKRTYSDVMLTGLPAICWFQDAMPHLYDTEVGQDVDARTLVVGMIPRSLVQEHGYPRDRCLSLDVPASARKFSKPARSEPEFDLFIAMNHGESPVEMVDRLENLHTDAGGRVGVVRAVASAIMERADQWRSGFSAWWLSDQVRSVLEDWHVEPAPEVIELLERDIARPMLNRVLRHRLASWACQLANDEGIRLAIAGRGWDRHEWARGFFVGTLGHGDELRDMYNNAGITLQAGSSWMIHQRIHECVLAGSLPGIMLKPEDGFFITKPAVVEAWTKHRPTRSRLDTKRQYIAALDDEVGTISLRTLQRVMRGRATCSSRVYDPDQPLISGEIAWGIKAGCEYDLPSELVTQRTHARYLDGLSDAMFWDLDELRSMVRTCREDPGWRLRRIQNLQEQVRSSFTYESVVPKLFTRLAGVLERP